MQTESWQRPVTLAAVGVVAAVAATVSYAHMYEVALAAGEQWRAALLPLSVDGLVVAASLSAWQAKRRDEDVPAMTVLSLMLGLLVSVAANVAVPFLPEATEPVPGELSAVVAAWPAIALALAFEQLLKLRGTAADEAAESAAERHEVLPREVLAVWSSLPQAELGRQSRAGAVPQRQSYDQRFAAPAAEFAARNAGLPLAADDPAAPAARVPERAAEQTAALPVVAAEAASDERAAARELVRAEPEEWTGKALAERFGKSERWGRDQVRAARDELQAAMRPRLVAVDE